MTTDLIKKDDTIFMDVSTHSNIAQRVNFLAQAIKDQKDAESQNIYIECYEEEIELDNGDFGMRKIIRLSTDLFLWAIIHPSDEKEGAILPKNIAVSLYDFYNIIDNCKDDFISFWIDEDIPNHPKLGINSFYNDENEYDELEVKLKINKIGFPKREFLPEYKKVEYSFLLDGVAFYELTHNINIEDKNEGINIVVKDRKIFFQTNYNGCKVTVFIKKYVDQIFMKDFKVFIPLYVFNLMASTGTTDDIQGIRFDIYDNILVVKTKDYSFAYKIEKKVNSFEISGDFKDFSIIEPTNMLANVQLLNRINKPAPISIARMEKNNEKTGDITIKHGDRYTASVRVDMAMFSDKILYMDTDILEALFENTGVDAVKMKYDEKDNIYIKYENYLIIKEIYYDHREFMKYREGLTKNT